ncbi:hypothetical protein D5125_09685 [Magnetovirga frankeli]|uniref:hypothetical protein n=1 Tax=Magnetovirga frankeli TaxID=947516 RepID=UPI0012932CEF|nr:hypothetical protein D5125_09685 [gamma proteobacterium SS-5]
MQKILLHTGITFAFILCLLIAVFFFWYPAPLLSMQAGWPTFIIALATTLILGPLMTAWLCRPGKKNKNCALDVSIIVLLQAIALAYGAYILYQQKPKLLVLVLDQFYIVTEKDLTKPLSPSIASNLPRYKNGPYIAQVPIKFKGKKANALSPLTSDLSHLAFVPDPFQRISKAFLPTYLIPDKTTHPDQANAVTDIRLPITGRNVRGTVTLDGETLEITTIALDDF